MPLTEVDIQGFVEHEQKHHTVVRHGDFRSWMGEERGSHFLTLDSD